MIISKEQLMSELIVLKFGILVLLKVIQVVGIVLLNTGFAFLNKKDG